jgi:hypothetical protein
VSARSQPERCVRRHPAQQLEAVRATVQGDGRLVEASLPGEESDLIGGDVGHVGDQDVDAPAQGWWQRIEEVAVVDVTIDRGQVAPGTAHRGRVDVGSVQLDGPHGGGQGRTQRSRATAEVEHNRARRGTGGGLAHQELAAVAGHEDARFDRDAQAAELRPADHLLERQPLDPPRDHRGEGGRGRRGRDQQACLLLREDAAGGAQAHGDGGGTERWRRTGHASTPRGGRAPGGPLPAPSPS